MRNDQLAFPVPDVSNGMTLRDYFAAQALAGLLSGAYAKAALMSEVGAESIAITCYDLAEDMLMERDERERELEEKRDA